MIYDLRSIKEADVKNKKVFLRADLDVPIQPSTINHQPSVMDDTRLKAWFPTLEYLLKQNAKVIIAGHLGRPKNKFSILNPEFAEGQFSISEPKLSLKPVARWLSDRLNSEYTSKLMYHRLVYDTVPIEGFEINENVSMLENLRFYKEEEENDEYFAKKLASLTDIYVNDAFASSHRNHASIVGITRHLPSFAGLRILKEVEELSKVLENPKRPLAVLIGGAKIETKLPLVEKMHHFADYVLVGGEIAENDKILLKVQHENVLGKKSSLLVADLNQELKDITSKSSENFLQILQNTQTIVWNGPMGVVEEEQYAIGTKILAEGIAKLDSYKILGGGDTAACIQKMGLLDKFNFVSIGGGAMLEFLAGEKLPGLEVLKS